MFLKIIILILNIVVSIQAATKEFYKGAVVEVAPFPNNVMGNAALFVENIRKASEQSVDIIVFPEIGLNGYGSCTEEMFTTVPHPSEKVVPCSTTNSNFSVAFLELSCAAQENNIYVVVNVAEKVLCPMQDCSPTGRLRYNTNVVFDRSGAVIARYRKFHLFGERDTNKTSYPELTVFDTDFGVRFGTFICFDIMFDEPALQLIKQLEITDIVFSTAWFSELPFLTALQAQSMWSYAMDVNLLASGYNAPEVGSGGSGIYQGRGGPLAMTFPESPTTQLLIAEIPIKPLSRHMRKANYSEAILPVDPQALYLKSDELNYFSTSILQDMESTTLCHNNFCCQFEVNYTTPNNSTTYHQAMVFDGVRTFDGVATGGVQTCAVISCLNNTLSGCGMRTNSEYIFNSIKIFGSFEAKSTLQMPSTLRQTNQLEPLYSDEFNFISKCDSTNCNVTMESSKPLSNLLTFGIYGRVYSRDGDPVTTAGANNISFFPINWLFPIVLYYFVNSDLK